MKTWKHLRAILLRSFMVTVVPASILQLRESDTLGLRQSVRAIRMGLPALGGALLCLGLVLIVAAIRLFLTVGKATLASWNSPPRLVIRGVYRHVHNPVIAGVSWSLFGEAS